MRVFTPISVPAPPVVRRTRTQVDSADTGAVVTGGSVHLNTLLQIRLSVKNPTGLPQSVKVSVTLKLGSKTITKFAGPQTLQPGASFDFIAVDLPTVAGTITAAFQVQTLIGQSYLTTDSGLAVPIVAVESSKLSLGLNVDNGSAVASGDIKNLHGSSPLSADIIFNNNLALWMGFSSSHSTQATAVPADAVSFLYDALGLLPPESKVAYNATFTNAGDAVTGTLTILDLKAIAMDVFSMISSAYGVNVASAIQHISPGDVVSIGTDLLNLGQATQQIFQHLTESTNVVTATLQFASDMTSLFLADTENATIKDLFHRIFNVTLADNTLGTLFSSVEYAKQLISIGVLDWELAFNVPLTVTFTAAPLPSQSVALPTAMVSNLIASPSILYSQAFPQTIDQIDSLANSQRIANSLLG